MDWIGQHEDTQRSGIQRLDGDEKEDGRLEKEGQAEGDWSQVEDGAIE